MSNNDSRPKEELVHELVLLNQQDCVVKFIHLDQHYELVMVRAKNDGRPKKELVQKVLAKQNCADKVFPLIKLWENLVEPTPGLVEA